MLTILLAPLSSSRYCDKLPADAQCSALNLTDQSLGDDGLCALVDVLVDSERYDGRGPGKLRLLLLQGNNLTKVGAGYLVRLITLASNTSSAIDRNGRFDLDVRRNSLGLHGTKQLREAVKTLRSKPVAFDVHVTGGGGIAGPGDLQLDLMSIPRYFLGKKLRKQATRTDREMNEWRFPSPLQESLRLPQMAVAGTFALLFAGSILAVLLGEVKPKLNENKIKAQ